jgi:polar amino acid transport system substrate-binding protein
MRSGAPGLAGLALLATLLCSCTGEPRPTRPQESATAAADCRISALRTTKPGRLTWATDERAAAPWVIGDPADGRGFEAAVAEAVTTELGFSPNRNIWTATPYDSMTAAGPKSFDLAFDQIPIPPERGTGVDFSSPYYTVPESVIARTGNPATDQMTAIADLRGLRIGATEGSASARAITAVAPPTTFATDDAAEQALLSGRVEALAVDLHTAFYLTTVGLKGTRIVGRLPSPADAKHYGFVLERASPLTACVTRAVDALRAAGTLAALEHRWLDRSAPPLR